MNQTMRLNLGSCGREFSGFTSVDICPPADVLMNLAEPWPWQDSQILEIKAYDIIEHIGDCRHFGREICDVCFSSRQGISTVACQICNFFRPCRCIKRAYRGPVHIMNEAWRLLVPGGTLDIDVPTTDGRGAWQDPEHVSFWNRNSFLYYTHGDAHRERFGWKPGRNGNGIRARFEVLSASETKHPDNVVKLRILLRAVKP